MKKKKLYPLVQAESSHWLHEISISKAICHHFFIQNLAQMKELHCEEKVDTHRFVTIFNKG
jgi:hypothetical protein